MYELIRFVCAVVLGVSLAALVSWVDSLPRRVQP